jgi:hypothetical protein
VGQISCFSVPTAVSVFHPGSRQTNQHLPPRGPFAPPILASASSRASLGTGLVDRQQQVLADLLLIGPTERPRTNHFMAAWSMVLNASRAGVPSLPAIQSL